VRVKKAMDFKRKNKKMMDRHGVKSVVTSKKMKKDADYQTSHKIKTVMSKASGY